MTLAELRTSHLPSSREKLRKQGVEKHGARVICQYSSCFASNCSYKAENQGPGIRVNAKTVVFVCNYSSTQSDQFIKKLHENDKF